MAKAKIRGLDGAAPADKMIRLVLRAQLNAMFRHREKAINWKDPEGVHDMRVLSRRLRSTINDFKPYFRKGHLPHAKLRSVADVLGTVRDEDVVLMALKELKSQAKGTAAEGIKLLIAERREHLTKSRVALKSAIQDSAVEEVRNDFLSRLYAITIAVPTTAGPNSTEIAISFRKLGGLVIKGRVADFVDASPCLFQPYNIKKLHKLRILAKRLRYAMELFARCEVGEDLEAMAKTVAEMQTALGELHDCDAWIGDLGARLKRLSRKDAVEPNDEKLRAGAIWLLEHFATERMEHYREGLRLWDQWQADKFLEKIDLLAQRLDLPVESQSTATPATQSRTA